jgi:hypothetical protein
LPWGQGVHAAHWSFRLPWGHGLHSLHWLFCLPCEHRFVPTTFQFRALASARAKTCEERV